MTHAQIALETLAIIGIVFFLFLIIGALAFDQRADVRAMERTLTTLAECERLSALFSSVYATGEGTQITLRLDTPAVSSRIHLLLQNV